MIVPNEYKPQLKKEKILYYGLNIGICILIAVAFLVLVIPYLNEDLAYETEVSNSLYNHASWEGHPWYIAPMEGKTVELYNGTSYKVIRDYWDSCEHNPEQGHLIGIGYINKTAYEERVILDGPVATRNFTATRQLLIWEDAAKVRLVK